MSEQCFLVDGAQSHLLCVLSLMRMGDMSQDHQHYPSQRKGKRKLRLREVAGHVQGHTSGAPRGQNQKSFWIMANPLISGCTEAGSWRSRELGGRGRGSKKLRAGLQDVVTSVCSPFVGPRTRVSLAGVFEARASCSPLSGQR